jgi:hypothetical protein
MLAERRPEDPHPFVDRAAWTIITQGAGERGEERRGGEAHSRRKMSGSQMPRPTSRLRTRCVQVGRHTLGLTNLATGFAGMPALMDR